VGLTTHSIFYLETEMDITAALNLITLVCNEHRGNLSEHKTIQEALKVVKDKINPPVLPTLEVPEIKQPELKETT